MKMKIRKPLVILFWTVIVLIGIILSIVVFPGFINLHGDEMFSYSFFYLLVLFLFIRFQKHIKSGRIFIFLLLVVFFPTLLIFEDVALLEPNYGPRLRVGCLSSSILNLLLPIKYKSFFWSKSDFILLHNYKYSQFLFYQFFSIGLNIWFIYNLMIKKTNFKGLLDRFRKSLSKSWFAVLSALVSFSLLYVLFPNSILGSIASSNSRKIDLWLAGYTLITILIIVIYKKMIHYSIPRYIAVYSTCFFLLFFPIVTDSTNMFSEISFGLERDQPIPVVVPLGSAIPNFIKAILYEYVFAGDFYEIRTPLKGYTLFQITLVVPVFLSIFLKPKNYAK